VAVLKDISKNICFYPEIHKQILNNWLDAISIDWPISRRRFYGTEIPVWFCNNCQTPNLPDSGHYYQPWKERPPFDRCSNCGSTEFTGEEKLLIHGWTLVLHRYLFPNSPEMRNFTSMLILVQSDPRQRIL
jgi:valyl-tRNA synthetase